MKYKYISAFAILFLSTAFVAMAQPGGGGPGGGGDPDVPITGIEILLAIGGLLGVRRIIKHKREAQ